MNFVFKKRGHSHEPHRLRQERNKILQPNKTRIFGKCRKTRESENTVHPSKGENKSRRST